MGIKLSQITEAIRKTSFEIQVGEVTERVAFEYRSPTPAALRAVNDALKHAEESGELRFLQSETVKHVLVRIQDGDEMVEAKPEMLDELPFDVLRLIYEAIQVDITPKKTS
jgi:hypothetical protein